MRRLLAALPLLAAASLAPAACTPEPRAAPPAVEHHAEPPVPVATATATATATAAAAAPSTHEPRSGQSIVHERGVVDCGEGHCDLGEICCTGAAPRCAPAPAGADPATVCHGGASACNDSIDCAVGSRCIEVPYSDWLVTLCAPPDQAGIEPCRKGGACLTPSATCELAGREGTCELPKPDVRLQCGGRKCGPAQGCCHDGLHHRSYCADRKDCPLTPPTETVDRPGDMTEIAFCTSSRGCRANEICFHEWMARQTFCFKYGSTYREGMQVCERAQDCRPTGMTTCDHLACVKGECVCP